jgi:hypothetical protein
LLRATLGGLGITALAWTARLAFSLPLECSMPSAMLEQEGQMFGLRERALPLSDIVSPQQMQTLRRIPLLPFFHYVPGRFLAQAWR